MIKLLGIVAIVGTVVAGVFGSASALGVTGGSVQAGGDSDLTCDTDGIVVQDWNVDYNGIVTSIEVDGINAACDGDHLLVSVKGGSGELIAVGAQGTGAPLDLTPNTVSGSHLKVQLAGVTGGNPDANQHGVSAHDIYSIDFVIEGGS